MTTLSSIMAVAGVLALAGYVQGLTGFGFGMIAMGLLTPLFGVDEALSVVTLSSLATSVAMVGLTLRHIYWPGVLRLAIGSLVGIPLGFVLMTSMPRDVVVRTLGLSICLLVAFDATVARTIGNESKGWAVWCFGLTSGVLSGAFNVGGPPLVSYIYGRPWRKEQKVATLSVVFLAGGFLRLMLLFRTERLPGATCVVTAWSVVPMLGAIVCGNATLGRVTNEQLRWGVRLALLAIGGRFLIVGS